QICTDDCSYGHIAAAGNCVVQQRDRLYTARNLYRSDWITQIRYIRRITAGSKWLFSFNEIHFFSSESITDPVRIRRNLPFNIYKLLFTLLGQTVTAQSHDHSDL